eukprot:CAMPEP_0167798810 /NCGR_PEP_ID=MMETSP0111_2-20121227/16579_1 /TAXON_ID=91324 /ORGANISM="Lotharella globosa, Strain CCCM811" /LENGTH=129 /DNA_ID=CAMNT_0007693393 /DNA_START=53 /DNA_END=442 /DNA_ORIENTATION=-
MNLAHFSPIHNFLNGPAHARVVLSIPQWTNSSMGWMMSGIAPSPAAVGTDETRALGALAETTARLVQWTTWWMVNPGMTTEAKACHRHVSTPASIISAVLFFSGAPENFFAVFSTLSFVSASTYNEDTP